MLIQEFTSAGELTRLTVSRASVGWNLREERGGKVVADAHYDDWHRLERALRTVEIRRQLDETSSGTATPTD